MVKDQQYHNWFFYVVGAAILLLFVRLGAAPIYILDEAKNAQCAREMWLRGDWIVPSFNGELRTDKPVLHYWFMRMAYSIAGANAGAARFFSGVAGLVLIIVTYVQTKRGSDTVVGFFAGASLLLSTHYLFEFRLSVPDPYLILFTCIGLFAGFNYLDRGRSSQVILAGIALGIAALAKGPVAYALPGIIFLIYIFIKKKWNVFKDPFLWLSGFIALMVALPWYYAVHIKTGGEFTSGFFLDHNLNRFSAEKEGHGGPFFVTLLIVILGMFPVSFLAIAGMKKRFKFFKQPLYLFSFVVVGVYILFFSISSTKLPNYPMPCYPFVAILAAYVLKEVMEGRYNIPGLIWGLLLFLALAIPVGGYFALQNEPEAAQFAFVALWLFILPIGILLAWVLRRKVKLSLLFLGISWVLFSAILLWVGYPSVYSINPVNKLSTIIDKDARVLAYRAYNPAFNFHFEKERMIIPMARSINELDSLQNLVTGMESGSGNTKTIYIITRENYLEELSGKGFEEIGRNKDLFELPTTVILRRRPKY